MKAFLCVQAMVRMRKSFSLVLQCIPASSAQVCFSNLAAFDIKPFTGLNDQTNEEQGLRILSIHAG